MSSRRLASGGEVDRTLAVGFSFDGRHYTGHPGDTLASALLAAGVRIVGRSSSTTARAASGAPGSRSPTRSSTSGAGRRAHAQLPRHHGPRSTDGVHGAQRERQPDRRGDRAGVDRPFRRDSFPAAFYYKTFLWPNWHLVRAAHPRHGRARPRRHPGSARKRLRRQITRKLRRAGGRRRCRRPGRACAAAERGQDVLLVDDRSAPGGLLGDTRRRSAASTGVEWARRSAAAFAAAGGRYLASTTAFGIYDHKLVLCNQIAGRWRTRHAVAGAGRTDRSGDRRDRASAHVSRQRSPRRDVGACRTGLSEPIRCPGRRADRGRDQQQLAGRGRPCAAREAGAPVTLADIRASGDAAAFPAARSCARSQRSMACRAARRAARASAACSRPTRCWSPAAGRRRASLLPGARQARLATRTSLAFVPAPRLLISARSALRRRGALDERVRPRRALAEGMRPAAPHRGTTALDADYAAEVLPARLRPKAGAKGDASGSTSRTT